MSMPPNAPPRSGSSCWKWGAIACIGCGCLVVVIVAVVVAIGIQRVGLKNLARTAQQATRIAQQMQQISEALAKYVKDRGEYPNTLKDLAPTYLPDSALRPSVENGATEFEYHKPPPNAPDSFVVVAYEMPNPVAPGRAPGVRYFLTKGGRLGTEPVPQRPLGPAHGTSPPAPVTQPR